MKAYVILTGFVFGAITVAHMWRIIYEPHLGRDTWFLLLTAATLGLSIWAVRLLFLLRRQPQAGI